MNGRAAYEVWRAAVPEIVCNVPAGKWEDLPETVRAGFDAIAAQQTAPGDTDLRHRIEDVAKGLATIYERGGRTRMAVAKYNLARILRDILAETDQAAQQPQPAPGLREAVGTLVADWREGSEYRPTDTRDEITEGLAVNGCADSLAAILDEHPEPQPALELAAVKAAVVAEIREAASCDSDDEDRCEKCGRHADAILAAIAGLMS